MLATLLFAWFPRRVEAVAWLSCRPDLLAGLFGAVSVLAFEVFVRSERRTWLAWSVAAWWVALLSKEAAVMLPVVHAALLWAGATDARGPTRPRATAALLPFLLSYPLFFLLRRIAIGAWVGGYGAAVLAPIPARRCPSPSTWRIRSSLRSAAWKERPAAARVR